jgi:hypothetical protein
MPYLQGIQLEKSVCMTLSPQKMEMTLAMGFSKLFRKAVKGVPSIFF